MTNGTIYINIYLMWRPCMKSRLNKKDDITVDVPVVQQLEMTILLNHQQEIIH